MINNESASKKSWKDEKRQRKKNKIFRVSEEEFAAFAANAKEANLSGGDFFRQRCCSSKPIRNKRIRKLDESLLAKVLGQLGKWGSNLNQIAHSLNIARKEPTYSTTYASKRLEEYDHDIAEIRAAIAKIEVLIQKALI